MFENISITNIIVVLMLLLIFFEFIIFKKKYPKRFDRKDTLSNIVIFLLPIFCKKFAYLANWFWFIDQYQFIQKIGLKLSPNLLTWPWMLVLFLTQDFMYYWFHRISHRIRWFWASHVTHHSSKYLNLSTALRHNIFSPLIGIWIFWLPLAFLGFSLQQIEMAIFLNITYQFFIHTQFIKKIHPIIDYCFNTPAHHRVHHGINEIYLNKNFGSVLIIWDRLFGTFQKETENSIFGILKPINYKNVFHANFDEYKYLFHELRMQTTFRKTITTLIDIK